MLNVDKYIELARNLKDEYSNNLPFPHIVIDNFLPGKIAEDVLRSFPSPEEMDKMTYQKKENKIATRPNMEGFPEEIRNILYALNSHEVTTFLEVLTGINGILPDPNFLGAGLHQTMRGGKLGVHVDFNYHKHLRLNRRINVIIYFNKDWQEEWGGHLELWDKEMKSCVHRISPLYNRCVIFNTTDISYHGHPNILKCPEDMTRKSIALYYYTSGRPEDDAKEVFWTIHQALPEERDEMLKNKQKGESMIKKIIRNSTPPVVYNRIRRMLNSK